MHCTTQGTRPVGKALHGALTLPNLFELLYYGGNKAYILILHEFGVEFQMGLEVLNHPELMWNCHIVLVPSVAQWFGEVR